jgi:hypothetical protein
VTRWLERLELRPETLLIQMYSLKVALAFGLSAVIVAGGEERFSGDAFKGPRALVAWLPVEPYMPWATLFLLLGAALVYGIGKPVAIHVLRFGMVVYVFLLIAFACSAFQDPTVAFTGCVAYTVFAAAHLLVSAHLDTYGWH